MTVAEIVKHERIVTTEAFEGMPDAEPALNVVTFREVDGRTTLDLLVQVTSREVCDMILATDMEDGMHEQFELLEALASSLR